jgi:hypothetical protein
VLPRYQSAPLDFYLDRPTVTGEPPPPYLIAASVDAAASDEELAELVEEGQRVWLIYHAVDFRLADPDRRIERWLQSHFKVADRIELYRIEATLYTPRE